MRNKMQWKNCVSEEDGSANAAAPQASVPKNKATQWETVIFIIKSSPEKKKRTIYRFYLAKRILCLVQFQLVFMLVFLQRTGETESHHGVNRKLGCRLPQSFIIINVFQDGGLD